MRKKNKIYYYIVITLIFLVSFRLYSSLFYPLLNSDHAVTVLMIHYFNLPEDLYFWGQDRMGSLIPLLGQIPFKIFNISALTSESIVHYFILLLGFFSFAHFLKSHFLKIIFAMIWFLPPMRLIDLTQLSFGIHYSLIAMSCYLFDYYKQEKVQENYILRHSILTMIVVILISSVWVSDMALVSVFLLLIFQSYFYLKANYLLIRSFKLFKKIEVYYSLAGFILGYVFISYAKSIAPSRQDYTTFSDFDTIKLTITIFWNSITDFFKFKTNEPFTSIYAYLVIILFVFLLFQMKKIRLSPDVRKWILFFLLDGILLLGIILLSHWTFLNGVPRRYFTCTYISISFFLLLLVDNLNTEKKRAYRINSLLFLTVFIGAIGTSYNMKYIWPKTLTPKIEIVKEFETLGQIGIIADYWNAYLISCPNPDLIKATPHDTTWSVRNYAFVDEVFKQENIYVIRDGWLQNFPDTLIEFGRVLLKEGDEFRIGDCDVCRYKKLNLSPEN